MSLFRQEVIDAKRADRLGSIRVEPPRLGWLSLLFALIVLGSITLLLTFGSYARREHVEGRLIPESGQVAVVTPRSGVVTRVFAADGRAVLAGEPLLEISRRETSAGLGDTQAFIGEQLSTKQQSLDAAAAEEAKLQRLKLEALREQIKISGQRQNELSAQIAMA